MFDKSLFWSVYCTCIAECVDSKLIFVVIWPFLCCLYQLYLQARFTWKGSKLLRHLLQAVALYAAIYVGLSRISDYKHHWSDVLMGAILGTIVAALSVSGYFLFLLTVSSYSKSGVIRSAPYCDCLAATGAYFGPWLQSGGRERKSFSGNMSGHAQLILRWHSHGTAASDKACKSSSVCVPINFLFSRNSKTLRPISIIQTLCPKAVRRVSQISLLETVTWLTEHRWRIWAELSYVGRFMRVTNCLWHALLITFV